MRLKWIAVAALGAGSVLAQTDAEKRLEEATAVIDEVMSTPEKSIPQDLLNRAECVVVVPGLKKGAFILGGKYGRGFVSCRRDGGAGWSAPAGVRVEGGSVGFQIGGAETDVLMLIMNQRGMEKLLKSKFTLGGDASVAAGPLGRDTSAQTDALMHAEILTWSRQRGAFAGVSLQGATLRQDSDANTQLYGRKITNKQIVSGGVGIPKAAVGLTSALNKYSSRK
jgi:lipid-binding SYLF domain-containing protein